MTRLLQALESRRLLSAGELDVNYGLGGAVVTEYFPASFNEAYNVGWSAMQPDGKVVVAGQHTRTGSNPAQYITVARHLEDGTLDPSFGTDGIVLIPAYANNVRVFDVAIAPDGKIVLAGGSTFTNEGFVFRLDAAGVPDSSFNGDGLFVFPFSTSSYFGTANVLADRKVLLAVATPFGSGVRFVRLTEAGNLDEAFGVGGVKGTDTGTPRETVVNPDGSFVVAARATGSWSVRKFSADGDMLTGSAFVHVPLMYGMTELPGGGFIVSGRFSDDAVFMRFDSSGERDLSFGVSGSAVVRRTGAFQFATPPLLLPNGRIVALVHDEGLRYVRLLPNGAIDTTLGPDGTAPAQTVSGAAFPRYNQLHLLPDGRVIATGDNNLSGPKAAVVAAYKSGANLSVLSSEYDFDAQEQPSVVVEFDLNVEQSLSSSDLSLFNLTSGQSIPQQSIAVEYDARRNTAHFNLIDGSVPSDGNYRATISQNAIFGPNDEFMSDNYTFDFFVLAGDANRDRTVNINDFSILASRFNLPGVFSQGDFNYDGVTNISDFAILASKFNTSLPAARTPNMLGTPRTTKPFVDVMRLDLDELR